MAGRNGTGPLGKGPMTGRGMGACKVGGYSRGRRPKRGRCFGYGIGIEDEKSFLERMKSRLELRLEKINERLEEIG